MGAIVAFIGFVLLNSSVATAQGGAEPRAPGQTEISVSRDDCKVLAQYADVGAADYKPGVDVNGRPVAGANLSGEGTSVVPTEITFTLTVRLADFVPGLATGLADSVAPIGEIAVRGRDVFLNDRLLNERQSQVLAEQCRTNLEVLTTE
jgi:hypothetical protein